MATLAAHGRAPELFVTHGPDDAAIFSRQLCERYQSPLIIAGGGDGTVNGVINGLLPGKATIAVLPFGTSNVLAKELRITSIDDGVQRIIRGATRPLSVGLLKAGECERYFLLMAGIGFDGFVVEQVRKDEKKTFRQGAYVFSAIRCLKNWERGRLEVVADGKRIECHSVIVCNGSKYGGRFLLAPAADIFSPGFQVVCIRSDARRNCLKFAMRTLLGVGRHNKDVLRFTASELFISGDKAVQVDGDFLCYSPVHIKAVAGFARLVI